MHQVAALVALSLVYLHMTTGHTTVDARGIRIHSLLRRRAWTWGQIEAITVKETELGQGTQRQVVVRGTNGLTRTLPAPAHRPSPGFSDPDFAGRAEAITTGWQEHQITR